VVLAGPVSGEVCGCLVAHDLGANVELLYKVLVHRQLQHRDRVTTFRLVSSSALGVAIIAVLRSRLVVILVGCTFP
jgi:hypothetical protein